MSLLELIASMVSARRHPDSGSTLMDGNVLVLFEADQSASDRPWYFAGGAIDLSTMGAGDTIVVKEYVKITKAGAYIQVNGTQTFVGPQPVDDAAALFGPMYNVYGIKVTAEQTAIGVYRTLDHEWFTKP